MFETPLDAWYAYVGVAAVSAAALGVALGFPTAAPPDATAAAGTVDRVASRSHAARASQPLRADAIRLRRGGLALRGPGGTARATFAYGPVTPVGRQSELRRVLDGDSPGRVFGTGGAFRRAVATARRTAPEWRSAGPRLTVRTLSWRGVDVTLVGA
ncbi:MAG: hypothetical protein ABEH47_05160 [Haloferacaceae archaeon]